MNWWHLNSHTHYKNMIGTRIFALGPQIQLHAAAAQTIGMALHELSTNAGKYGALFNDTGRVTISWQILPSEDGEETFVISWVETGGPPVKEPTRKGFGSVVTGKMAEHGLKASAQTTFGPDGLEWLFSCKANAAREGRKVTPSV